MTNVSRPVHRATDPDDDRAEGTPWVRAARDYWLSTPLGDWLVRNWRLRLGTVLWVGALAAAASVGFFSQDEEQVVFLTACVIAWLAVLSCLRLTPSAGRAAGGIGQWIERHAWKLTLAGIFVALGAVVFSDVIRSAGPGGSVAGLALLIALAAVWLALVLRVWRLAVGVADKLPRVGLLERILLLAAAAIATLGPIIAIAAVKVGGDPPLSLALVLALGPAVLSVLLLGGWYAWAARRSRGGRGDRGTVDFVLGSNRMDGDEDTSPRHGRRRIWAGRFGLAATALTVLSGVFLFAAAAHVSFERQSEERSAVAAPGGTLTDIPEAEQALVEFYAPVLRLAPDEEWIAADAVAYATRAWADHPDPEAADGCLTPPEFTAGLPIDDTAPCLELYGPTEGYAYADLETRGGESDPRPVFGHGKVYPRIVHVADPASCREGRTCRILDYWFFYPNNVWRSATAIGDITQSHGGDWEHVAVGIDRDRQGVFVAYSAHCTGYKRPWRTAATVGTIGDRAVVAGDAADAQRSHPLVVVARGSHANYPTTGRRDPDWAGCSPSLDAAAGVVRQITLQAGAVETTPEFGPIQIPTVEKLGTAERVLAAPWWWGPDERYSLGGLGGGEDESHGPASPALQPPFRRLFDAIQRDWDCERTEERRCRAIGLGGD